MTIVVGYVARPEGRTALRRAVAEATLRREPLLVVNAARGDAYADSGFAPDEDLDAVRKELAAAGVEFEVRRLVRGNDPADEVIDAANESGASLIVIGLRRRTPVGKLLPGQHITTDSARGRLSRARREGRPPLTGPFKEVHSGDLADGASRDQIGQLCGIRAVNVEPLTSIDPPRLVQIRRDSASPSPRWPAGAALVV